MSTQEVINAVMKACDASKNSDDPSTKVGAAIIKNGVVIATGYNRPPKGWEGDFNWNRESKDGYKDTKYPYVVHAEVAAISSYEGSKRDLEGSCMCVTLCPCDNCAKTINEHGIKTVLYLEDRDAIEIECAKRIFEKCGIKCISIKDIYPEIEEELSDVKRLNFKNSKN